MRNIRNVAIIKKPNGSAYALRCGQGGVRKERVPPEHTVVFELLALRGEDIVAFENRAGSIARREFGLGYIDGLDI